MRGYATKTLLAAACLLATAQAAIGARVHPPGDAPNFLPSTYSLELGSGAWSYFGDARSVAHGKDVFTGWISRGGDVWVAQTDTETRKTAKRKIYANLGRDDHNNPSLIFWRGRLMAFFSEHSGVTIGKGAQMRYRVAKGRHTITEGFGPVRKVPTNTPGGLGYTYPNPVRAGGRLFLFWRGGDWNPTFSVTGDGFRWRQARTLVTGPGTRLDPQRPYAKYAEAPGRSFVMTFSDAHVKNHRNSLYFLRYDDGVFRKADGTRIGTLADVPFSRAEVDVAYRYRKKAGRAWPHDVAVGTDGQPVIAFTGRRGGPSGDDTFRYGRFDGEKWTDRKLIHAGAGSPTFTSGGVTLDHDDPSNVVLSRRVGAWNQVEAWRTEDRGVSWDRWTLTQSADAFSMRPVFPRDFRETGRGVVLYYEGTQDSYTDYRTEIKMLVYEPLPAPAPTATPTPAPTASGPARARARCRSRLCDAPTAGGRDGLKSR